MDAIATYQAKLETLNGARQRVVTLTNIVSAGALALRTNPLRVFVEAPGDGSFPMEASLSRDSHTISDREWPDAGQLRSALTAYHEAIRESRMAYDSIPENQRSVVTAPPDR